MPEMYRVEWLDSGMSKDLGWSTAEDYLKDVGLQSMNVVTVGMVMYEDEDVLVLGLNYDPHGETWIAAQIIARSNLIRVDRLHAEGVDQ